MAKSVVRLWNIPAVKALVHNGIKEGTKRCADNLLAESQELVPKKTGKLQHTPFISGFVDETPSGYMVRYYADSSSDSNFDYAIIQHEEEGFTHDGIRTDHYLRIPAEKNHEMYKQWIAEAVKL